MKNTHLEKTTTTPHAREAAGPAPSSSSIQKPQTEPEDVRTSDPSIDQAEDLSSATMAEDLSSATMAEDLELAEFNRWADELSLSTERRRDFLAACGPWGSRLGTACLRFARKRAKTNPYRFAETARDGWRRKLAGRQMTLDDVEAEVGPVRPVRTSQATPLKPTIAERSDQDKAREAALEAEWDQLPEPERESILAMVKAGNPGLGRWQKMLKPLCLAELERRRSDPPPGSPPPPPAPRPAAKTQIRQDRSRATVDGSVGSDTVPTAEDAPDGDGDGLPAFSTLARPPPGRPRER